MFRDVAPDGGPAGIVGPVIRTDVLVLGGGPAGAAAAIQCASLGLDTILADKATFPRDKHCGDGLTTGALRLLEDLGLDPASVPSWQVVADIQLYGPTGHGTPLELPAGPGYYAAVARRAELDAAVLDLAAEAGATVLQGTACTSVTEHDDRVRAELAGHSPVEARYVIAADGAWSPTRKMLGLTRPGYRGDWHAFRQYFTDVTGPAAHSLCVSFESEILPGYSWSFPLPDRGANVGFGVRRDPTTRVQDMAGLWPELLERPALRRALGPDARPEGPHRAWPIPASIDETVLTSRRTLFVGDAAAACDPMTGEGIAQALLTGRLAADALAHAGPLDGHRARQGYEQAVQAALVADHRMAAALGAVLATEWGCRASIALATLTPWTRRNFARWLFEDYPRAIIVTPRRWRRGMFTGPGAFARAELSAGSSRPSPMVGAAAS